MNYHYRLRVTSAKRRSPWRANERFEQILDLFKKLTSFVAQQGENGTYYTQRSRFPARVSLIVKPRNGGTGGSEGSLVIARRPKRTPCSDYEALSIHLRCRPRVAAK